jgi:hypothetical protein
MTGSVTTKGETMAYVLQQFKVADYATFENVYLDDADRRRRLGSKGGRIFHPADDDREITVLLEWDNAENAHKFAESVELREAVKWATSDVVPQSIAVLVEALRSET